MLFVFINSNNHINRLDPVFHWQNGTFPHTPSTETPIMLPVGRTRDLEEELSWKWELLELVSYSGSRRI